MNCECGKVHVALTGQGSKCAEKREKRRMVKVTYVPLYLQETTSAVHPCGSWDGLAEEALVTRECSQDFEDAPFVRVHY